VLPASHRRPLAAAERAAMFRSRGGALGGSGGPAAPALPGEMGAHIRLG
jgi:hypothetical protein